MKQKNTKKRIQATVLALMLLLLSFPFSAYAADTDDIIKGDYNVDVDIEWGVMSFVYTTAYKKWNPDTHEYDIKVDAEWTVKGNDITVTNVGANGVKAEFSAEKIADVDDNVTLGFKATNDAQTSTPTYQMELTGASGDTTSSGTVYFDISGTISETYEELATVTITIIAE